MPFSRYSYTVSGTENNTIQVRLPTLYIVKLEKEKQTERIPYQDKISKGANDNLEL